MNEQLKNLTDHSIAWDWKTKHVSDSYSGDGIAGNTKDIAITDFIDSSTTLLVAGPASLSKAMSGEGIRLVPIGVAMGINLSMQRQTSKIYEIGSRLGYTITGRTAGGMQINRALIDGANLLKLMYAGEVAQDWSETDDVTGDTMKRVRFLTGSALDTTKGSELKVSPIGSGAVALNLDSAFFNHPFGLGLIFRDQRDNTVSQHYFEGCLFSSYNINIAADQNILTEGVSIEYTRCVPVLTKVEATSAKIIDYMDDGVMQLADIPLVGQD